MSGADWAGVALGTLGSLLVAVGLWIVLPRGVALTKLHPVTDWRGEVLLDTWRLRNVSALPIEIESVAYMHFGMAEPKDLPTDGISTCSVSFDDEVIDNGRTERGLRWKGLTVPPGESLTAHVGVNHSLTVKYRGAGLGGCFERRSIVVHGYS